MRVLVQLPSWVRVSISFERLPNGSLFRLNKFANNLQTTLRYFILVSFLVNPVAIGNGLTIFNDRKILKLESSIAFKNGKVLNKYLPV